MAGSNRESRSVTVYMFVCVCVCWRACAHARSETQLDSEFVILIDSVHCKSSKKLNSGIIILTVTNTLPTNSHKESHSHTHKHKHKLTHRITQKITYNALQDSMPRAFLTVKLSPDEYLPAEYICHKHPTHTERDTEISAHPCNQLFSSSHTHIHPQRPEFLT